MRETIERWLSDGKTFVGIFENQAFDSADFGRRIGMAFELSEFDKLNIGDRAPDTSTLIGWKYLCVGKAKTMDEALGYFGTSRK